MSGTERLKSLQGCGTNPLNDSLEYMPEKEEGGQTERNRQSEEPRQETGRQKQSQRHKDRQRNSGCRKVGFHT